jgi:hypothetical protein
MLALCIENLPLSVSVVIIGVHCLLMRTNGSQHMQHRLDSQYNCIYAEVT